MPRHVDVHDAALIVGEDDEDEQDPAGERRDREEVDRDRRAEMVVEERAPALRGVASPAGASAEKPSARRRRSLDSTIPVPGELQNRVHFWCVAILPRWAVGAWAFGREGPMHPHGGDSYTQTTLTPSQTATPRRLPPRIIVRTQPATNPPTWAM